MSTNTDRTIEKRRTECLILAQAFEGYWAYYMQSDGALFADECRECAEAFVNAVEDLSTVDPRVIDGEALTIGENSNVDALLDQIRHWANGETLYPIDTRSTSHFMIWVYCTGLKSLLMRDLGVQSHPPMVLTPTVFEHSEQVVRWKGHLPKRVLQSDPADAMCRASETSTIAIVADIRRSQDLMTYSADPKEFSTRMVALIDKTRSLLDQYGGIFDKFTGDGFVCYFNEHICDVSKQEFRDSFVSFCDEMIQFASKHFEAWTRTIRKIPSVSIGLAIGADIGPIVFEDLRHHLVAVGEPIVWAARMAAAAQANEVLINNLLKNALSDRVDLAFNDRCGATKSGEDFSASLLSRK